MSPGRRGIFGFGRCRGEGGGGAGERDEEEERVLKGFDEPMVEEGKVSSDVMTWSIRLLERPASDRLFEWVVWKDWTEKYKLLYK